MHVACKCNDIKNTINKRSSAQQSPLHDATADNDTYDSSLASEPARLQWDSRTGQAGQKVGKRKSIGKLFVTARCAFWQRRRATTHEDCSCAVGNHHHQCTSSLWGQQAAAMGEKAGASSFSRGQAQPPQTTREEDRRKERENRKIHI